MIDRRATHALVSITFMGLVIAAVWASRNTAMPTWEGMLLPPTHPGVIASRNEFGQLDIENSTVLFFNLSRPVSLLMLMGLSVLIYFFSRARFGDHNLGRISGTVILVYAGFLLWSFYECFGPRFYL